MTLYDLWLALSFFAIMIGAATTAQPFMVVARESDAPINRWQVALGAGMYLAGVISLVGYQIQNQP